MASFTPQLRPYDSTAERGRTEGTHVRPTGEIGRTDYARDPGLGGPRGTRGPADGMRHQPGHQRGYADQCSTCHATRQNGAGSLGTY